MMARDRYPLMLFLAADVVLIMLPFESSCGRERTVRTVREEIKRNLPLGSTSSQVIAYLDAKHIGHSDLVTAKSSSDYPGEHDIRLILASIPLKPGLLSEWGIFMSFRFDKSDRLIDYRVNLLGT